MDFLIGMSVFLLAVAFVFGIMPNLFEPFATDGGSDALVADRAGARIAEDILGEPGNPAVLNATCTQAFFAGSEPVPDGCRYSTTDLNDALGLDDRTRVNVSIEDDGNVELARGHEPPTNSASIVVARRVVLLDGETNQLFVRVW